MILDALKAFADTVTAKMNTLTVGEPENQLRGPFETFMQEVGQVLALEVVCAGETRLPGRMGKPDFAVHAAKLLAGYVELKAPKFGANTKHFSGHNKDQWKRFSAIPNLIYTSGNEWGLYRSGKLDRPLVRLTGDVSTNGKKAVTPEDASAVLGLLTDFLQWQPTIPTKAKGKIDLKAFAAMLAPLCRMLRNDVTEALKDSQSPLVRIAKDWRELLFPHADDEQFADAYAQTVTFALLLARSEGADPLSLPTAEAALAAQHNLLSRALQVLTDPNAQAEISASLNLLIRVIAEVPPATLNAPEDPWLYFYEDFLAVYDSKLRKDAGAYYTPVEVVRAQVRLVDDLLTNRLGKPLGFADSDVITLDPATGTGTYLLGVIDHALGRVQTEEGKGAVPGRATALAKNIYGFELMVGPYAVSELRVSRSIQDNGGKLPPDGIGIYMTDTLESPYIPPRNVPYILSPMADHHKKALKLKRDEPVLVCLGNPPYDRHEAATTDNKTRTGSWVRWGKDEEGKESILQDFLRPAQAAGHGVHLKNLYNFYVYFWRWALWKVFEWKKDQDEEGNYLPLEQGVDRPGVVSYISASSYLDGDAFCGMREHMRQVCDEVWILDLGGEGRGTRQDDNVFAIQTPVTIAVAVRKGKVDKDTPAKVHYSRIEGSRVEKLETLNTIINFASVKWQDCPDDWHAPFRPAGKGEYFALPLLTDLMPWQQPGMMLGRRWPICPSSETLVLRWRAICRTVPANRSSLFKESSTGRKVDDQLGQLPPGLGPLTSIHQVDSNATTPSVQRYGYRSFDRQNVLADARLIDRPGPPLWECYGKRQIFLATLLSQPLSKGPTVTVSVEIPDRDFFRGSYGARLMLLYRDAAGTEANILPGLLNMLFEAYGRKVSPEDFLAYVYGLLAQSAFTERYAKELETRELRIPLTKDASLFEQVRDAGARLLWLHTYGERFVPKGKHKGHVPKGNAKCIKPIPGDEDGYPETYEYNDAVQTLHVGAGVFGPVTPEVYEFEVSGLKVVQSWLGYRMKNPKGKKSSPLDEINPTQWPSEFTTELLELLWVLEATLAEYPAQAKLLEQVVSGKYFTADELPGVPEHMRKPPIRKKQKGLFDAD